MLCLQFQRLNVVKSLLFFGPKLYKSNTQKHFIEFLWVIYIGDDSYIVINKEYSNLAPWVLVQQMEQCTLPILNISLETGMIERQDSQ